MKTFISVADWQVPTIIICASSKEKALEIYKNKKLEEWKSFFRKHEGLEIKSFPITIPVRKGSHKPDEHFETEDDFLDFYDYRYRFYKNNLKEMKKGEYLEFDS